MKYILAPILLLAIVAGYAAAVIGLAVTYHIAGPAGAFVGLLALFASCAFIGGDNKC